MQDHQCLFCKMATGTLAVPKVYEDGSFFCIRDIHPQAKTHLLVIPKVHIPSLEDAYLKEPKADPALMGTLLEVAAKVAKQEGLLPGGFRCVVNTGSHAGQTVFHLHLHVLGGEPLRGGFGS